MAAIEVTKIMEAVAAMQAELANYNQVESAALVKRDEARQADAAASQARDKALYSIAAVQLLLSEVQDRAKPKTGPDLNNLVNARVGD